MLSLVLVYWILSWSLIDLKYFKNVVSTSEGLGSCWSGSWWWIWVCRCTLDPFFQGRFAGLGELRFLLDGAGVGCLLLLFCVDVCSTVRFCVVVFCLCCCLFTWSWRLLEGCFDLISSLILNLDLSVFDIWLSSSVLMFARKGQVRRCAVLTVVVVYRTLRTLFAAVASRAVGGLCWQNLCDSVFRFVIGWICPKGLLTCFLWRELLDLGSILCWQTIHTPLKCFECPLYVCFAIMFRAHTWVR